MLSFDPVSFVLLLFLLLLLRMQTSIHVSFIPILILLLQNSIIWFSQTSRIPSLTSAWTSEELRKQCLFLVRVRHIWAVPIIPRRSLHFTGWRTGLPFLCIQHYPLQAHSVTGFITKQLTRLFNVTPCFSDKA